MSQSKTPYSSQPVHAFWRKAVSAVLPAQLDPVVDWPIAIDRSTRVATAGSCFAQHIARRLSASGFHYLITEPAHPLLSADQATRFNYGTFSARYGNIYTARQLLQLAQRALGEFEPVDQAWQEGEDRWVDPFRPNVQPVGFSSREELIHDRHAHLAAVRTLFEQADVFVFTLGLTECWTHAQDGAAYPLCPGVVGGKFDASTHLFRNFAPQEVVADLEGFLDRLRSVNAGCRLILTVSPVPLIATATPGHVLPATTYSKSVLRVAAQQMCERADGVAYFPSYEIVTSTASRGRYFADDCRDVTEEGVDHVMRVFFRHAARAVPLPEPTRKVTDNHESAFVAEAQRVVDTICEENLIEQHLARVAEARQD